MIALQGDLFGGPAGGPAPDLSRSGAATGRERARVTETRHPVRRYVASLTMAAATAETGSEMYAVVIKILTPTNTAAEAVWVAMCALADQRSAEPILSLSIEAREARCEA